jgi:type I restriction enzyme S subunit
LRIPALEGLTIPLIAKEQQDEAAALLGALDDRIDSLRIINESMEATARAIFKSWFVDFDPVRAKAEDREPEGMDADIAALFPCDFVDSRLGQIPDGWHVDTLGAMVKIAYGKNLPTAKLTQTGFPVFGGNGQIGFNSTYLYETRQVLVACRGAASGKVNQSLTRSFVTNNSLVIESGPDTRLPFGYLKGAMQSADLTPFVTGSAQPQVTIENLRRFEILVPSTAIVCAYESVSAIVEEKIEQNELQRTVLRDLRDTLLPRLVSGKLRVPKAEKLVEAVI